MAQFNNKNLFSNYFLKNKIQEIYEWKNISEAVFQEIKGIYTSNLDSYQIFNESQLEDKFFRPIFRIIHPEYEVQAPTVKNRFPDYGFFPDKKTAKDAHLRKGDKPFYNSAYAIGEVKAWNKRLDEFGKNIYDRSENPSFQMWLYIHETKPKWGILSNGVKWRLYRKDKALDCFFEVDLVNLLENDDIEGFKYFYYFFRKEAFLESKDGEIFVDKIFQGSEDYAKAVGDNLKENVYKALKKIADGFFSWRPNGLDLQKEQDRLMVQKSSMKLLYRFLFLLYAEGKGLLSLKNLRYLNDHSFYHIKKEIKKKKEGPKSSYYSPASTNIWSRLKSLFHLTSEGSEALNINKNDFYIPAYDGSLFDSIKNPNLENWTIQDIYLADAIDLLARSELKRKLVFVDYSTLGIRHLGSIYEGLLEYKLKIAEIDMVVKGKKNRVWISFEEFNKNKKKKISFIKFNKFDRVSAGELYLATDKGERKTTGSYYTPEYIVDYIIQNTVGPVINQKWKEASEKKASLVKATLSMKILDLAMGSGHFLVGAIEYLAGKLLRAVQSDIDKGLLENKEYFTPQWAKREIVSHCIYGVDLNDLAVELAKVSLWLTTISKDKPLSFLDFRLKQGNSLLWTKLSTLLKYPEEIKHKKYKHVLEIPQNFIETFVDTMNRVSIIEDKHLSDIKKKEAIFENLSKTMEYDIIKTMADLRNSYYFGNKVSETKFLDFTSGAFSTSENEWKTKKKKDFIIKAIRISEERKFFHWELEFPEIFYEGGKVKENPGWDVIIGNPPYIKVQELEHDLVDYSKSKYSTSWKRLDISILFFELGFKFLKSKGLLGYITSNQFLVGEYGRKAREMLLNHLKIDIDFAQLPIFEEATTYTSILIITRKKLKHLEYQKIESLPFDALNLFFKSISYDNLSDDSWDLSSNFDQDRFSSELFRKLGNAVNYGLITGNDDVFIKTDKEVKELKLEHIYLKDFIRPQFYKKYEILEPSQKIIYPYDEYGKILSEQAISSSAPNTYKHLKNNKTSLLKRKDSRSTVAEKGILWYCLIRASSPEVFLPPKIIFYDVGHLPNFMIDEKGYYFQGGTSHSIKINDLNPMYLLALLNSSLLSSIIRKICPVKAGDARKFGKKYISMLPIREIYSNTTQSDRVVLLSRTKELYNNLLKNFNPKNYEALLKFVEERLPKDKNGNFQKDREESDVISDFLAFLAEKIIEMNNKKNNEIRGFIEWFERELNIDIETLKNKTKLKKYFDLEFNDFLSVLKQNQKKISKNLSNRSLQNNLKEELEKSVQSLSPIRKNIEQTDKIINQIVYKLYDLTDEEIKLLQK